jgi:hypothetical protein
VRTPGATERACATAAANTVAISNAANACHSQPDTHCRPVRGASVALRLAAAA